MSVEVHHGDALDVFRDVRGLASIVSDPPGGGSFMNLPFDVSHGGRDRWIPFWAERFKVAREATERGSYGLFWAFGRTAHWTSCALDDAGWEIVRPILHLHGQGWSKAKSQLKPAQEVWWLCRWGGVTPLQIDRCRVRRSWAERSESWFKSGHSAKPDARKIAAPPGKGIEIHPGGSWAPDLLVTHCPACREVGSRKVRGDRPHDRGVPSSKLYHHGRGLCESMSETSGVHGFAADDGTETVPAWECLAACTCGLASLAPAGGAPTPCPGCGEERWWACPVAECDFGGTEGGASRFYPCFHYDAKASTRERQSGCEALLWLRDESAPIGWRRVSREEYHAAPALVAPKSGRGKPVQNKAKGNVHATIKSVGCGDEDGLMRWLVRLITPPGGRVGDICLGSGSTGVACQIEGHQFVGCDIDSGAVDIARARLAFWTPERHRQVLADDAALKAHERAVEREKGLREGPRLDDLPLFAGGAR